MFKIVLAGVNGRMGQALQQAIEQSTDCLLHGALVRVGSELIGQQLGEVVISDDIVDTLTGADVLIDFTRPEATMRYLAVCKQLGVAIVIGTTGFDDEQKAHIANAGQHIGVVFAPNMSVGVNLTFKLLELAAQVLNADFDVEIIEAHHRHKVDSPSGTALRMGEVVANALGRELSSCAVYGREGNTGERAASTIGFSTVRGGDIVGDHTVLFAGTGERVEISHKASSRMTFALGALRAVRFLAQHPAGYFDMQDVLGLRV